MKQYHDLLRLILEEGFPRSDRTGTGTIGVFGAQAKFDLRQGFPLLTTKKVFTKGIFKELLWFLSGNTNIQALEKDGVKIWTEWPHKRYNEATGSNISLEEFRDRIINDDVFAADHGDLGMGSYAHMWRHWPTVSPAPGNFHGGEIDQISEVVQRIKDKPDDRRLIVTAWNPELVSKAALPPCHCFFQFSTQELSQEQRRDIYCEGWNAKTAQIADSALNAAKIPTRRLHLQLYQRSCDTFLGVPFNIASYALLLQMVAQVTGMQAGTFTHTYGDLHIYRNHLDQVHEQLSREPRQLPRMKIEDRGQDIFGFRYEDFKLLDYNPHPAIKGEVSV